RRSVRRDEIEPAPCEQVPGQAEHGHHRQVLATEVIQEPAVETLLRNRLLHRLKIHGHPPERTSHLLAAESRSETERFVRRDRVVEARRHVVVADGQLEVRPREVLLLVEGPLPGIHDDRGHPVVQIVAEEVHGKARAITEPAAISIAGIEVLVLEYFTFRKRHSVPLPLKTRSASLHRVPSPARQLPTAITVSIL